MKSVLARRSVAGSTAVRLVEAGLRVRVHDAREASLESFLHELAGEG